MAKQKLLEKGHLIQTNPSEGYWGCAVVLSERDKTKDSDPICHIGITPFVFRHEFAIEDLDISHLSILKTDTFIRVAPNKSEYLRTSYAIGIFTRKIKQSVKILDKVDVTNIFPDDLSFNIGDGTDGGWPMSGSISMNLGFEAVHEWRKLNDYDAWKSECEEAEKSFEEMIQKRK